MQRITPIFTIALAGLLFIAAPPVNGQEKKESTCKGKYKGGKKPTAGELKKILKDHGKWIESHEKEGRMANLCEANLGVANLSGALLDEANLGGANLGGANLSKASLWKANLSEANLWEANLSEANLGVANLSKANLWEANLSEANLWEANLSGAYLWKANLSKAILGRANLSGTTPLDANLSGADMKEANLSKANLSKANLAFSVFELKPGSLPAIQNVALARNLSKMTFRDTPLSMVELREEFKKKGLRKQEREITFAIKHTERIKLWGRGVGGKIESAFQYILFETTSDYGMSPWRPLLIVVILIPLFSIPYMIGLKRHKRSGIWIVLPEDRVHKSKKDVNPIRVTANFPGPRKRALARWFRVVRIGLYFSLLSAFRIGWRELNVGNWITRMQFREYILRATGWVRFVSGLQSLISVYLIALWILTYFGRPFE